MGRQEQRRRLGHNQHICRQECTSAQVPLAYQVSLAHAPSQKSQPLYPLVKIAPSEGSTKFLNSWSLKREGGPARPRCQLDASIEAAAPWKHKELWLLISAMPGRYATDVAHSPLRATLSVHELTLIFMHTASSHRALMRRVPPLERPR